MGAPRVLLVGNFLSQHVSTRAVCEELAERLTGAGWQVLTTSGRIARLPRLLAMQQSIWRYRRSFDVAQIDVFSGNAFFWAEAAAWSLERLAKPFVLTLHGGLLPDFARRWPRRVRRLLGAAAAVTTPSRYLEEAMAPYRRDLLLLPNPLELGAYAFVPRREPAPKLVWLRAFHATYVPELAPRVLAKVREVRPEATLTMIGPDKGDGSLERTRRTAAGLGVTDGLQVVLGVPKSEVPRALAAGDVFLNTTAADNTPVSVLEAMACGLVVVSTNAGGLGYLLEHGRDALLVPPGDAEAMAAATMRLLTEPGLAAELGQAGRVKVEAFDWSRILPAWQVLLRGVAVVAPGGAKP